MVKAFLFGLLFWVVMLAAAEATLRYEASVPADTVVMK